jgi:hypothetical protein
MLPVILFVAVVTLLATLGAMLVMLAAIQPFTLLPV